MVEPGIYKHYKGALYKVTGCARHSETEEWLVCYQALYGEYGYWVRPMEMFMGFELAFLALLITLVFGCLTSLPSSPR